MNPPVRIAPSILAADFLHLEDAVRACETGGADVIHCDVMDGRFVPNLTFGPPLIRQLSTATKLGLDVHLMIDEPERSVEWYQQAGAATVTVHQEVSPHLHRTLSHIRSLGARSGVALNPSTPIQMIEDVLDQIDYLLVMTVNPGFGGQKFIPAMLSKIQVAGEWRKQGWAKYTIAVDGGIDLETAPQVVKAGADMLVAGTFVFRGDIGANIRDLRKASGC